MLNRLKNWVNLDNLKTLGFALIIATILFFLYFWRIGSLTPGLSIAEDQARTASSSLQSIKDSPVNAPHKLAQNGLIGLNKSDAFWMRSISLAFAMLFLVSFYYFVRCLFGLNIAFFSMLIFASTPLFINLAHSATPAILYLSPLSAYAAWEWFCRSDGRRTVAWFCAILATILCFYSPGGLIFLLIALFINISQITATLKRLGNIWIAVGAILLIALVTPLFIAMFNDTSLISNLLLLPDHIPQITSLDFLKSIAWGFSGLVLQAQQHVPEIIARLPILDIIQIVLGFFGIYALFKKVKKIALAFLLIIILSIILAALSNKFILLACALPACSIFVAAGLRYLYVEWFQIFPRNPLPQAYALLLMSVLVALHVGYGIRYSLMAWPNVPQIKSSYVIK